MIVPIYLPRPKTIVNVRTQIVRTCTQHVVCQGTMASETPTLQLDDAPGNCQLNNGELDLATMEFFRGKSGANRTAKAHGRLHGHQIGRESPMEPYAVNGRRDYYYATGTNGTRASDVPSEDDNTEDEDVKCGSVESGSIREPCLPQQSRPS